LRGRDSPGAGGTHLAREGLTWASGGFESDGLEASLDAGLAENSETFGIFGGFLVSGHLGLLPNLADVCVPDFFELIRQLIFGEIPVGLAGDIEAGVELDVGRSVVLETHRVFLDDDRAPLNDED